MLLPHCCEQACKRGIKEKHLPGREVDGLRVSHGRNTGRSVVCRETLILSVLGASKRGLPGVARALRSVSPASAGTPWRLSMQYRVCLPVPRPRRAQG